MPVFSPPEDGCATNPAQTSGAGPADSRFSVTPRRGQSIMIGVEEDPFGRDSGTTAAPPSSPAPGPFEPTQDAERSESIDILRGIAILGILLVNVQFFFAPMTLLLAGEDWWTGPLDRLATALVHFFAQGKFYTMFSFLFGLGMALQMERAEARGRSFVPFFARRMSWLLLLGTAHAFLLWFGDILATYALLGFSLILFRRRATRTLLVWTVVLFLIPLLLMALFVVPPLLAPHSPAAAETEREFAEMRQGARAMTATAREVYSSGTYLETLPVRASEVALVYRYSFIGAPGILAMFLVGLNLGRRRFLREAHRNLSGIRRWLGILACIGLPANAVLVVTMTTVDQGIPSAGLLLQQIAFTVGGPALCFTYVLGVVLLLRRESWRRRLLPLAAVGRLALTSYLTHSLVFTTIANGYGLGFYGRVGPAAGLALAVALFAAQIALSNWWLRRFRFGPFEWLWRSLSYLRLQPIRR